MSNDAIDLLLELSRLQREAYALAKKHHADGNGQGAHERQSGRQETSNVT